MKLLTVRHATFYRYDAPVSFGQHRLMLRPRDSHDLRLTGAELTLSPPGTVRWMHDVFGNSVALVDFASPASELSIVSTLTIERYALARLDFPIAPEAASYPFMHSADDRSDLGRLRERHYPDPRGVVDEWARQFILETPADTFNLLATMNAAIRGSFEYRARDEEGTQAPIETLESRCGTCRDYALLFIEAARALGFGARFVTGYLYDPALDGGEAVLGAGATHAWAEIYLPGAGWVEFDPTNGLIAAENLIRIAVTRDPAQAVPIAGTFAGEGRFIGMEVEVSVKAEAR
jgi:transglutaminase-like putative cysteine protease